MLSYLLVLLDLGAVIQRHFPTGKINHPATGIKVPAVQWCLFQYRLVYVCGQTHTFFSALVNGVL
jgi:hypothetical protein